MKILLLVIAACLFCAPAFAYNDYPRHSCRVPGCDEEYLDYVEAKHPEIYATTDEILPETFLKGHSGTALRKFNNKTYRIHDNDGREITAQEYLEATDGKGRG